MLGSPIGHSLSPVLHAAAYRELGLTGWSYDAIECDAAGLAGLLDSLGPDWVGLSLTMPLKRAVLPLLDQAEQLVTDVGGANTVLLSDGRRAGYNTDVPGIVAALREGGILEAAAADTGMADAGEVGDGVAGAGEAGAGLTGDVLVLGGGATACSALAAVQRLGATELVVAIRDAARAGVVREVADRLGLTIRLAGLTPDGVRVFEPGLGGSRRAGIRPVEVGRAGSGQPWQLLISTVPAGGADGVAKQIAAGDMVAEAVFDVVYDPWPTLLAGAATAAGATVISGFELLLYQAAVQVELMTGRQAPVLAMRASALAEIARRRELEQDHQ